MNIVLVRYIQEPPVTNTESSILEAPPSTSPNKKEEVKFIMIKLVFFFFFSFTVEKLIIKTIITHMIHKYKVS